MKKNNQMLSKRPAPNALGAAMRTRRGNLAYRGCHEAWIG